MQQHTFTVYTVFIEVEMPFSVNPASCDDQAHQLDFKPLHCEMQDMCPHPSLPLPKSLLQTPAPAPDHKLTLNRNWEAYMRAIAGGHMSGHDIICRGSMNCCLQVRPPGAPRPMDHHTKLTNGTNFTQSLNEQSAWTADCCNNVHSRLRLLESIHLILVS